MRDPAQGQGCATRRLGLPMSARPPVFVPVHRRVALLAGLVSVAALARGLPGQGVSDAIAATEVAARPMAADTLAEAFARAQRLARRGHTAEAVALFDAIVARDRTHRDAALAAAAALAWGRRLDEAEWRYAQLLAASPDEPEAAYGLARVAAWRGQLALSEARWRRAVDAHYADPAAWVGLAQLLRWQGKLEEARFSAEEALRLAPGHEEARQEIASLKAQQAVAIAPVYRVFSDNEGNQGHALSVDVALPVAVRHEVRLQATERQTQLGGLSATARQVQLVGSLAPTRALTLRASAGGVQRALVAAPSDVVPTGQLQLALRAGDRLAVFVGGARTLLDETALMLQRPLVTTGGTAAIQLDPWRWLRASGSGSAARIRGGSADNTRHEADARVAWRRGDAVEVGVQGRVVRHDRLATDGYFSPREHLVGELVGRFEPGRSRRFGVRLEGGVGRQRVTLEAPRAATDAWRGYAGLAYRWALGGQVQLGVEASSVAGLAAGTGADGLLAYRRHGLVASGRVPLGRP